jgi:hypothetical protein
MTRQLCKSTDARRPSVLVFPLRRHAPVSTRARGLVMVFEGGWVARQAQSRATEILIVAARLHAQHLDGLKNTRKTT